MRTSSLASLVASLALASALLAGCSSGGGTGGSTSGGSRRDIERFLGQVPPEVPGGTRTLDGRTLTLASLRGQVVYVQFSFPACPACHAVLPTVNQWYAGLAGQGFTAMYCADGRRDTPQGVASALSRDGVRFPVLYDQGGAMTQAYGVTAFPTAFVIGRDGRVVWEGIPSYDTSAPQRAIEAALAAR
jgi:cytochrome oxidase Cu insertion factor (SCO1/SenC/PrrC family)